MFGRQNAVANWLGKSCVHSACGAKRRMKEFVLLQPALLCKAQSASCFPSAKLLMRASVSTPGLDASPSTCRLDHLMSVCPSKSPESLVSLSCYPVTPPFFSLLLPFPTCSLPPPNLSPVSQAFMSHNQMFLAQSLCVCVGRGGAFHFFFSPISLSLL